MKYEGSLSCPHKPVTDPYPACHTNPVHNFTAYFPKIHSNIILPFTSRFSEWFSGQNFACISCVTFRNKLFLW
jgi:hypothetical protein